MRGVYYRTEKDGTPLATPELRISATNNRTVYYDNQNAKEAALQNGEIKEGSIVLTGYADGESEVVIKQQPDWENAETLTVAQLQSGYVVPSDGYVCLCCLIDSSLNASVTITVNGVGIAVAWSANNNAAYSVGQAQCQVNKGDVIRLVNDLNVPLTPYGSNPFNFVPFKTVAEPLTLPVNLVPEKDKYLHTEVKTNKTWVDGKPIYRKVVTLPTAKAVSGNSYIDLGITFPNDADTMFIPEVVSAYGNLMYYNNYKPIKAACKVNVSLEAGTNFILEYTKN